MKYLKRFNEELHFNENVDYKYIVDLILNTDGNYNIWYNPDWGGVAFSGTTYDKGELVSKFNAKPGDSSKIKNNFYFANKNPNETKKEVEELSNGKIEVTIKNDLVLYKKK